MNVLFGKAIVLHFFNMGFVIIVGCVIIIALLLLISIIRKARFSDPELKRLQKLTRRMARIARANARKKANDN